MSKRKHDEAMQATVNTNPPSPTPVLYTSAQIHDRNSTFQAIFTTSSHTITDPKSLQRHPPFSSAMHKILAWRRPSSQKSISSSLLATTSSSSSQQRDNTRVIFQTGSDEDGEKYAGKKLEKVLVESGVEEGTVVVARWWGGVMLGPVRFKWIEDCAREAISMWKRDQGGHGEQHNDDDEEKGKRENAKRLKVGEGVEVDGGLDEERRKERLVNLLMERDQNVAVLRRLLAEKNELLKNGGEGATTDNSGGQADMVKSPTSTAPDYRSMSLDRLRQMEKARDATLGWILKQIDAVEEKLKATKDKKVDDVK